MFQPRQSARVACAGRWTIPALLGTVSCWDSAGNHSAPSLRRRRWSSMKPRAVFPTRQAPRESRSVYATGTTSSLACAQCGMPGEGLPPLWSAVGREDILDLEAEEGGDLECQRKAGVVLALLDRDNGLTRHSQAMGKLCLGPPATSSELREPVLH